MPAALPRWQAPPCTRNQQPCCHPHRPLPFNYLVPLLPLLLNARLVSTTAFPPPFFVRPSDRPLPCITRRPAANQSRHSDSCTPSPCLHYRSSVQPVSPLVHHLSQKIAAPTAPSHHRMNINQGLQPFLTKAPASTRLAPTTTPLPSSPQQASRPAGSTVPAPNHCLTLSPRLASTHQSTVNTRQLQLPSAPSHPLAHPAPKLHIWMAAAAAAQLLPLHRGRTHCTGEPPLWPIDLARTPRCHLHSMRLSWDAPQAAAPCHTRWCKL